MKLNIGSGTCVIEGYKSVDADAGCKPDIHCNILNGIPVPDESVERILFLHTIEHIQKSQHPFVLKEFHRILQPEGTLVIAYPEFSIILQNWLDNKQGIRHFWEHTIYGCQRTQADFHVSAMDTKSFIELVQEMGFKDITYRPDATEPFNTILECTKGVPLPTYADIIKEAVFS